MKIERPSKVQDLTNFRSGKLVAVTYSHQAPSGPMWECRCDCGNTKVANAYALKRKGVRSCGCLIREVASKRATQTGSLWKRAAYHPKLYA